MLLAGCKSTLDIGAAKWPVPEKPEMKPVEMIQKADGFFITQEHASNLADNVESLQMYSEKLETLINAIGEHYK